MFTHVAHNALALSLTRLMVSHPLQCLLEEVLTDRRAIDQIFCQSLSPTARLREVALGIADERPCIYGIVYLLLIEGLARNVYSLKPLKFFGRLAFTNIYSKRIIEDVLLYIIRLVEKVLVVKAKLPVYIFAERERALLPVHHLISAANSVAARPQCR